MNNYLKKLNDELDELKQILENLPEDSPLTQNVKHRMEGLSNEIEYRQLHESQLYESTEDYFKNMVKDVERRTGEKFNTVFQNVVGQMKDEEIKEETKDIIRQSIEELEDTSFTESKNLYEQIELKIGVSELFKKFYQNVQTYMFKILKTMGKIDRIEELDPQIVFTTIQKVLEDLYDPQDKTIKESYNRMVLKEGISHIEDIKLDEFIEWVTKIIKYDKDVRQSIKIDGVQNISFSIVNGKIYGQRLSKNQLEVKKTHLDWSTNPIYNFIRSQHKFMEIIYEKHKQVFDKYFINEEGNSFECEIVPPTYGNVMKYGNQYGMVIFIRSMDGNITIDGKTFETKKINDITFNKFITDIIKESNILKFDIKQYFVEEESKNINIIGKTKKETWGLEKIDIIEDLHQYLDEKSIKEIQELLEKLDQFLNTTIEINEDEEIKEYTQKEINDINLSTIKMKYRDTYGYYREIVNNQIFNFKNKIKKVLLNSINKKVEIDKYHAKDIEGMVFKDTNTGKMVKLIDRNYFTQINKFLWSPVEKLRKTKGDDIGVKPKLIKNVTNLIGSKYKDIVSLDKTPLDSIIKYVSEVIPQEKIDEYIKEIQNYTREQKEEIDRLIKELETGIEENTLTLIVKKFDTEEKEIKYDEHLYKRFKDSMLIEKKYYIDLLGILDKNSNNLIKLITQLYYIFENKIPSDINMSGLVERN